MFMESLSQYVKPSYYKDQFTGWTKSSYILLTVGILIQLYTGLMNGINTIGVVATIAGIIGFTCTIAITNGKSINGMLGLISALMFIFVAFNTDNISTVIMQLFYIFLLDLPIIFGSWKDFTPKSMKKKDILVTVLTFIGLFVLLFAMNTYAFHSPQALLDALAATIGLTGAILCVRQFKAQYYLWTFQGLMSIALWTQTALNGNVVWVLMITYILYLANDVVAFADSKWFDTKKLK